MEPATKDEGGVSTRPARDYKAFHETSLARR